MTATTRRTSRRKIGKAGTPADEGTAGRRTARKGAAGSDAPGSDAPGSDAPGTDTADRRSPATPMLVLLASACVVMAVGCLALWHQSAHDQAVERARDDARSAAQSAAKDLLSYNYRTLDYDLSKAKSEMTPGMAKSFDDYWRIFRPSVEKSQTQALTQIEVTGVTDATPTRVEVVLFVKMISVNAAHKEPQVDTSWPRLQMQKIGKKWLIDGPRMTTPPPASSTPSTPAPSSSKKAPGKRSGKASGRSSGKASTKP
jgi:Mce-associated membrane protein